MRELGKSMESALKTLLELNRTSGEDCVPTYRINSLSKRNVNAATMRALERKKLVRLCQKHRFNKPFLVGENGKLEPVEYDQVPHLIEQGREIVWVPLVSYAWELTPKGAQGLPLKHAPPRKPKKRTK